jgi:hypothetical protein
MRRLRWLEMELPFSMRTFGNKLKARTFTNDLNDGFLVDRVRDNYIEARYIEKAAINGTVTDPLGNEYKYERVDYKQTEFRLTTDYPHLELMDAPRGIQSFTSCLSELGNFSLSVSPIEADVLRWAEKLSEKFPDRFIVDALQASGLAIDENVTARIILSGTVDVRRSLDHFTNGRQSEMDRLQARFGVGSETARVILFSDGGARVAADSTQEITVVLRRTLASLRA